MSLSKFQKIKNLENEINNLRANINDIIKDAIDWINETHKEPREKFLNDLENPLSTHKLKWSEWGEFDHLQHLKNSIIKLENRETELLALLRQ